MWAIHVLQRHGTDPCAYGNRDDAEDTGPFEAVCVQYGLLLQAPNCVLVALTACRAVAGVEAARLCPGGNTPANAWSAVQTRYATLPGASLGSELVPSWSHTAAHTRGSLALRWACRAAYHMCSRISAQPSCSRRQAASRHLCLWTSADGSTLSSTKIPKLVYMSPSSFRNKNIKGSIIQDILVPHCRIQWRPRRRHADAMNPCVSMLTAQLRRHRHCCQRSCIDLHHLRISMQGNTLEQGWQERLQSQQICPYWAKTTISALAGPISNWPTYTPLFTRVSLCNPGRDTAQHTPQFTLSLLIVLNDSLFI